MFAEDSKCWEDGERKLRLRREGEEEGEGVRTRNWERRQMFVKDSKC